MRIKNYSEIWKFKVNLLASIFRFLCVYNLVQCDMFRFVLTMFNYAQSVQFYQFIAANMHLLAILIISIQPHCIVAHRSMRKQSIRWHILGNIEMCVHHLIQMALKFSLTIVKN